MYTCMLATLYASGTVIESPVKGSLPVCKHFACVLQLLDADTTSLPLLPSPSSLQALQRDHLCISDQTDLL